MEYNVVVAPDLETLGKQVNEYLKTGWRLKDGIVEQGEVFAQQLVRNPVKQVKQKTVQRQRNWIDVKSMLRSGQRNN